MNENQQAPSGREFFNPNGILGGFGQGRGLGAVPQQMAQQGPQEEQGSQAEEMVYQLADAIMAGKVTQEQLAQIDPQIAEPALMIVKQAMAQQQAQ
jgi:hypothetical protein